MDMGYKKTKNLLKTRDEYSAYYGDFRGVDFSSDHTQVHNTRFAYAVNMYKDYQSSQGHAIETVPGFRRRVETPNGAEIYGIHSMLYNGTMRVLIHAGNNLYHWHNYPDNLGVRTTEMITIPEDAEEIKNEKEEKIGVVFALEGALASPEACIKSVTDGYGLVVPYECEDSDQGRKIRVYNDGGRNRKARQMLVVTFVEGADFKDDYCLFFNMSMQKSTSFVLQNKLYILDGKNYLVYDGMSIAPVFENAYIPTTYIGIVPNGVNADTGKEYERRNLLQRAFKNTFVADGTTTEFFINENALQAISEVKVYGETVTNYELDLPNGKITFQKAPMRPEDSGYPAGYAGIEITAERDVNLQKIGGCTLAAVYDERVFLSGNPLYPNTVFFSSINPVTRQCDPTYFPVDAYQEDGIGQAPITGMLTVADALMILKSDTQQDGSVYYHTPKETGDDLYPKIYPSVRGLAGIGCLGACINFLDDPVFVSRLGLEAVGQLSVRYERAIEHRSSLVDAKLVNMDLSHAVLEEWNGYLVLLVDGKIFMADSRQRYADEVGVMQYEWYYLEDIGVFENQYLEYRYVSNMIDALKDKYAEQCARCGWWGDECSCGKDKGANEFGISTMALHPHRQGEVANPPNEDGSPSRHVEHQTVSLKIDGIDLLLTIPFVPENGEGDYIFAYLCETRGNYIGGQFKKAKVLKSMDGNLFFGTENGVVCSFNFDMRNEDGVIPVQHYHFDGRTIFSGCATKMDCCGIPHLTKNTVKKSAVIKMKTFQSSAAKIKVRTNRKPYEQIARINSSLFSFENMDFADFSFLMTDQSLFSVREKEKKWVEKQYYVYSDEYLKPFALYYISFRYRISGRYKE